MDFVLHNCTLLLFLSYSSRKGSIIVSYIVKLDSTTVEAASKHINDTVLKSLNGAKIADRPVDFKATKDLMEQLNTQSASKYTVL